MSETNLTAFCFLEFVRNENGTPSMNGSKFLCSGTVNGKAEIRALERQVLVDSGVLESQAEENLLPVNARNNWKEGKTRYLLQKYEEYINEIGPMKKFRTKKAMWETISDELTLIGSQRSGVQCENRMKTLLKQKKKALDANRKSGSSRTPVEFEGELNRIASLDDSIEHEVRRGIGAVAYKESVALTEDGPSTEKQRTSSPGKSLSDEPEKKRRKYTTVQHLVRELTKQKEEANRKKEEKKDMRHKERLETERAKLELLKYFFEKRS